METALKAFGLESFRPGQEEVIGRVLAGTACLAVFPTGGGKSLCYQLPAQQLDGVSVVVSPLLALMRDQVDALQARGIAAGRLDSTQNEEEQAGVLADLRAGRLKLLYLSPERFLAASTHKLLASLDLGLLAIDEAHCVSEWGQRFRPDYLKLGRARKKLAFHGVLALTATASPAVERDIRRAFGVKVKDVVRRPLRRAELSLELRRVAEEERLRAVVAALRDAPGLPGLVYVRTQAGAERVCAGLAAAGFQARSYHAGMDGEARREVQAAFLADGIEVVVATIAFGMGVDKANLRQVIHYDLPLSIEAYQQETGRAGRDREASRALALVCEEDWLDLHNRQRAASPVASQVEALLTRLRPGSGGCWFSIYDASTELDLGMDFIEVLLTRLELDGVLKVAAVSHKRLRVKSCGRSLAGYGRRALALLEELVEGPEVRDLPAWCDEREIDLGRLDGWLREAEAAGDLDIRRSHRLLHLCTGRRAFPGPDKVMKWVEARREADEKRLESLRLFLGSRRCLNQALEKHFGEPPGEPCGACSVCRNLSLIGHLQIHSRELGLDELETIRAEHQAHRVLKRPVSLTRFLLGLYSPALGRWRLTRRDAYGSIGGIAFDDLLAQVEIL